MSFMYSCEHLSSVPIGEGSNVAQFRVFGMLCSGRLNKQIAYEMQITEATVKAHMTAVLRKLGAANRTQAVLLASRLQRDPTEIGPPLEEIE